MFFIKNEQKWHVVLVVCEVHSTVTSLASFWKQLLLDYYFVFIYLATILSFSALKDKLKMKILPLSPPHAYIQLSEVSYSAKHLLSFTVKQWSSILLNKTANSKNNLKKKDRKCFHKIHKVLIKADPKIYLRRWYSHPRQAHVFFSVVF